MTKLTVLILCLLLLIGCGNKEKFTAAYLDERLQACTVSIESSLFQLAYDLKSHVGCAVWLTDLEFGWLTEARNKLWVEGRREYDTVYTLSGKVGVLGLLEIFLVVPWANKEVFDYLKENASGKYIKGGIKAWIIKGHIKNKYLEEDKPMYCGVVEAIVIKEKGKWKRIGG